MPRSITYTPAELLALRDRRLPEPWVQKITHDEGVDEPKLTRAAEYLRLRRNGGHGNQKSTKQSSSESDEQLAQKAVELPPAVPPAVSTGGEWQYHGRSGSEIGTNDPLPAPSGLAAQKDEGFRRFYKAVVSPTHVRVTAGGRIVPNTRGPPSPTAKWNKDKNIPDGANPARFSNQAPAQEVPQLMFAQAPFNPMPAFYPAVAPGIGHIQPQIPFMQIPVSYSLPNGLAMPGQISINRNSAAPTTVDSSGANAKNNNSKSGEGNENEKHTTVRVSPQEHFDHNRPFLYNGQWVMPQPNPYFHVGLMGQQMFPAGFPGQVIANPSFGINPALSHVSYHPAATFSSQQASAQNGPSMTSSAAMCQAPGVPPPSSIRMSEITKKHLENLRVSLKKCEDQLQYNRHQIDERQLEQHAELIRANIQQFEAKLQSELAHEKNLPVKLDQTKENNSEEFRASAASARTEEKPASTTPGSVLRTPEQPPFKATTKQMKPEGSMALTGFDSTKSTPSIFALPSPANDSLKHENSKKLTGLPSSAALAPPFQPRGESLTGHSMTNGICIPKSVASQVEIDAQKQQLLGLSSASQFAVAASQNAYPSDAASSKTRSTSTIPERNAHDEIPYLVGILPQGMDNTRAKSTDYIYGRSLTEDEMRARYLYWGKAPASVLKGLPRFDGKDFYPPSCDTPPEASPVKESRRLPIGNTIVDFALPIPRREPDPFAAPEPVKSGSPLAAIPQQREAASEAYACASTERSKPQLPKGDFEAALNHSDSVNSTPSSDEDGDGESVSKWTGRRGLDRSSVRSHTELWQSMLKKTNASATALPGAVTSMTAQGYLPQYSGHAAASLTPAMANSPTSSARRTPPKATEVGNAGAVSQVERRGENQPPATPNAAVEETRENYRKLTLREHNQRGLATQSWNA